MCSGSGADGAQSARTLTIRVLAHRRRRSVATAEAADRGRAPTAAKPPTRFRYRQVHGGIVRRSSAQGALRRAGRNLGWSFGQRDLPTPGRLRDRRPLSQRDQAPSALRSAFRPAEVRWLWEQRRQLRAARHAACAVSEQRPAVRGAPSPPERGPGFRRDESQRRGAARAIDRGANHPRGSRAGRLRRALQERRVHPDVLRFCRAELLQDNYFHAGTFRNTTAHAPKIHWPINEQDALDILTLASLLHRRLDGAVRTPTIQASG